MKQECLMLGAGFGEPKRRILGPASAPESETRWWTLDINPDTKPGKLFDLEQLESGTPLPYEMEQFDEVHAYEILEHFGRQGDYRGLFASFRQFWRVLKKDGLLIGTTPSIHSTWLWGDPGHTRVISQDTLSFFLKSHYEQLGKTAATDYRRFVEPCWWELDFAEDNKENLAFALRKVR
jgi:SAM-dependent methyltransferase